MATTKEQLMEIITHLEPLGLVTSRPMMGEYLVYLDDVYIGGVYDGQLLIKAVPENQKYNLPEVLPYPSAKRMMYSLNDYLEQPILNDIISTTKAALKQK